MNPSSKYPLGSFLIYSLVLLYKAFIKFVLNWYVFFLSFYSLRCTQETCTDCIVCTRHMFLRLPDKNLAYLIVTHLEHISNAISRDKAVWSMKHLHIRIMWCQQIPSILWWKRQLKRLCDSLEVTPSAQQSPTGWVGSKSSSVLPHVVFHSHFFINVENGQGIYCVKYCFCRSTCLSPRLSSSAAQVNMTFHVA